MQRISKLSEPALTCDDPQVFVTVGTPAKRKFLLATFPQLLEDHIGDSRSLSFQGMVRNVTKGKGVHLLLNSLSDEKLQATPHPPPPLSQGQRMQSVSMSSPGQLRHMNAESQKSS